MNVSLRSFIFLELVFIIVTMLSFSELVSSIEDLNKDPLKFCGKPPKTSDEIKKTLATAQLFGPDEQEHVRVPWKILFVVHPNAKTENKERLGRVFPRINKRIEKMMKGPPLTDLRFPRSYDADKGACIPAQARDMILIPEEFARPCYDDNGVYVPEPWVTKEPSKRLKDLTKENYTIVVYIGIYQDTVPVPAEGDMGCGDAGAWGEDTFWAISTNRPIRGVVLLCDELSVYTTDLSLENVLLHELMHAHNVDFSGSYATRHVYPCGNLPEPFESCENITWKKVVNKWKEENGTITTRWRFLSLLPSVVEVAKKYFKCDSVEGIEFASSFDKGKWHSEGYHLNGQIFKHEILGGGITTYGSVSAITLAFFKDSKWYDVDMSKAEPMVLGPVFPTCGITEKSCHQIVDDASLRKDESAFVVNPYCIAGKSPMCSTDGRYLVQCTTTSYCSKLYVPDNPWAYEDAACHRNTKWRECIDYDDDCADRASNGECQTDPTESMAQKCAKSCGDCSESFLKAGSRIGPGTMCVTFTQFVAWKNDTNHTKPMCVEFECQHSAKRIALKLRPQSVDEPCEFYCAKEDSYKIKHYKFTGPCADSLQGPISFWCSNYNEVCQPPDTEKIVSTTGVTDVKETTENLIQVLDYKVKLDIAVQHQHLCQTITLEAFKTNHIDPPRWYSFGYPEIKNCSKNQKFLYTRERIHACISIRDIPKLRTLYQAAKKKYPTEKISRISFHDMPLKSFTCETDLKVGDTNHTVWGLHATDTLPFMVTFEFKQKPEVRAAFKQKIENSVPFFFRCHSVSDTNPIMTKKYEIIVGDTTIASNCKTTASTKKKLSSASATAKPAKTIKAKASTTSKIFITEGQSPAQAKPMDKVQPEGSGKAHTVINIAITLCNVVVVAIFGG